MIYILLMLVILLIYCIYLLYRVDKVCDYQVNILHKIFQQDTWEDLLLKSEKVSFERMLFSFKPLKDEYWFDEEFINNINKK